MSNVPEGDRSPERPCSKKLKTLIVDDHPASILLLQDMLAEHCECFAATGGPQAIALFDRAIKEAEPFDIVLLDIEMPGMDGIEVLKVLRESERHWKKHNLLFGESKFSRIIMQTASDSPQDFLGAYLEGRCNGYINKPFHKKELLAKILAEG
ncbi:MAG: response regulator [Magnetococcales bacterium]|nr:response regulator [Magnetococcales bacterium]